MRLLDRLRAHVSSPRGLPHPPRRRLGDPIATLRWRMPRRVLPRNVGLPRYTVRLRLTLMYGCVFLVCGAGLLAITYLLVRTSTSSVLYVKGAGGAGVVVAGKTGVAGGTGGTGAGGVEGAVPLPGPQVHVQLRSGAQAAPSTRQLEEHPKHGETPLLPPSGAQVTPSRRQLEELRKHGEALEFQARSQHDAELRNLLGVFGIALAIMAVVSMGLGWLLAGRALRPLQTITAKARAISASNLHERLALRGPDDELRELGDTIDGLLARLEASFSSQRQFVANASHELRTPLTVERALLEVALADPDASADSLRHACERVLASSVEQERLIEALLTLASSERGLERREPLDLGAMAAETVRATAAEARLCGVHVTSTLGAAPTRGDPRLVARLARNLVDNALRYNIPAGDVEVTTEVRADHPVPWAGSAETGSDSAEPGAGRAQAGVRAPAGAGRAVLTVTNTGPAIPPGEVARLLQPFQRLGTNRTAAHGHGLGLSIVQAIAAAHGAALAVHPRPRGGLRIEVAFPLAAPVPLAADAREREPLLR
jgi:signal transduction histidine kinase